METNFSLSTTFDFLSLIFFSFYVFVGVLMKSGKQPYYTIRTVLRARICTFKCVSLIGLLSFVITAIFFQSLNMTIYIQILCIFLLF